MHLPACLVKPAHFSMQAYMLHLPDELFEDIAQGPSVTGNSAHEIQLTDPWGIPNLGPSNLHNTHPCSDFAASPSINVFTITAS